MWTLHGATAERPPATDQSVVHEIEAEHGASATAWPPRSSDVGTCRARRQSKFDIVREDQESRDYLEGESLG